MRTHFLNGLLLVGIMISCYVSLNAQPFMQQVKAETPQELNFFSFSDAFEQWAKNIELDQTKGWKYYQRWEWENASRVKSDGSSAYMSNYIQAYTERLRKYQIQYNSRSSIWSPVGPLSRATATSPVRNHGQGRVNCIAFHPSDSNIIFAGTSSGGVWKTTNGGLTWTANSDGLPILRVSDIAIAAGNPNIMYVATGDYEKVAYRFPSSNFSHYGVGLYKSIDAGMTWTPTSLSLQAVNHPQAMIGTVLINPNNPNDILVSGFDGIQKSNDGGTTWTTTFDSLIWDLKQDPTNFNVLYAGSGHVRNYQKGRAEIYKSSDFGATWTRIGASIPNQIDSVVRIELAIAPSNTNYLYALTINTNYGTHGVYQSTDAGTTWTLQLNGDSLNLMGWHDGNTSYDSTGQGWYDVTLITDHSDPNKVYVGGVNMWGSENGGQDWGLVTYWINYFGKSVHADHHQVKHNPLTNQYFVCSDGGIDRTDSLLLGSLFGGLPTQWTSISDNIANTEFYRIGLGNLSSKLMGGSQDNGTFLNDGAWANVIGGDGMECMVDHQNEQILYGTYYYGALNRSDDGGANFIGGLTDTITASNEKGAWVTPFVMNAQNSSTIYTGFGNVWKSMNQGATWMKLSPFDTITGLGYPQRIRTLAVDMLDSQTIYLAKEPIWSRSLMASVWVTRDEGATWTDISAGLPFNRVYINDVAIGNGPDTAWVVCGGIEQGEKVYQTNDGGTTWVNISGTLPNLPVNSIVFDPVNQVLYIGTDLGVYYRQAHDPDWSLLGTDLPNVMIAELEIHHNSNKLYAATYGRGVWKTDLVNTSPFTVQKPLLYQAKSSLYPNPTTGHFTLVLEQLNVDQIEVEIVDVLGQVVYKKQEAITQTTFVKNYDIDLESGQYYIRVIHGEHSLVEKLQLY